MATWTTIPDSSLEPGKPIRSIDALALRDNPVAIAEGASGAPRNQLPSLENPTAGSVVRSRYDETFTTDSTYQIVAQWGTIQTGTFTVTFEHRADVSGPTSSAQVVRNRNGTNTVLQTWSTTSTTFQARSINVPVIPGDTVIVQHADTSSSFGNSQIRNIRLQTNGERWWPAPTYQRTE